jgi:transcriptional regulator with XRE-family HTH domain
MGTRKTHDAPMNLLAWRTGREWSQRDAARLLGVTQGYYSKVENQIVAPRPKIAKRFTEKTGVPLASIMGIAS